MNTEPHEYDGRLLLINIHNSDLIINLAKYRSARASTLRQNREFALSVKLPFAGTIDLCRYLEVDLDEARKIIAESGDVQLMLKRGQLVVSEPLISEAKLRRREELARLRDQAKEERQANALVIAAQARAEEIERAKKDAVSNYIEEQRQNRMSRQRKPETRTVDDSFVQTRDDKGRPLPAQDAEERTETTADEDRKREATPSIALAQQLDDNMPSSRWTQEKLLNYARSKGIQVVDGASKNAILRKIRGL